MVNIMKQDKILNLFTIPVCSVYLQLNNNEIEKHCIDIRKKDKGRKISNSGGWQSNNLNNNIFDSLKKEIETNGNKFANYIGLKTPLKISNIWININEYKDSNDSHTHPHAILSGVYYVKTPKNCGHIQFTRPEMNVFHFDWNNNTIKEKTTYTSPKSIIESKENNLLLFPSWLTHSVDLNLNKKEERISISFNLINDY